MKKYFGMIAALAIQLFQGSGVKKVSAEKAAGIPVPAHSFGGGFKSRRKPTKRSNSALESKKRKYRKMRRRLANASRKQNQRYAKAA